MALPLRWEFALLPMVLPRWELGLLPMLEAMHPMQRGAAPKSILANFLDTRHITQPRGVVPESCTMPRHVLHPLSSCV